MRYRRDESDKTQAQIAGGTIVPSNELPRNRQYLRDFELISTRGERVRCSDYRGKASLVLILSDGREATEKLMWDAACRYAEVRKQDAEVLVITHTSRVQAMAIQQRLDLPYVVLVDEDGKLHRDLGATDSRNDDWAAVYITDRFGEVFAFYRTSEGHHVPDLAQVLSRLEFISFQCPECEPPEWPV